MCSVTTNMVVVNERCVKVGSRILIARLQHLDAILPVCAPPKLLGR